MSVSLDKAKEVRKGEGIDAAVLSAYLAKALDKPEGEVVIKQFPFWIFKPYLLNNALLNKNMF